MSHFYCSSSRGARKCDAIQHSRRFVSYPGGRAEDAAKECRGPRRRNCQQPSADTKTLSLSIP